MAITEARITGLEGQVKEHDEWINGNGKPGAKVQLNTLDLKINELCKKMDEIQRGITGLIYTVVGAIVIYILLNVIPHVAK